MRRVELLYSLSSNFRHSLLPWGVARALLRCTFLPLLDLSAPDPSSLQGIRSSPAGVRPTYLDWNVTQPTQPTGPSPAQRPQNHRSGSNPAQYGNQTDSSCPSLFIQATSNYGPTSTSCGSARSPSAVGHAVNPERPCQRCRPPVLPGRQPLPR